MVFNSFLISHKLRSSVCDERPLRQQRAFVHRMLCNFTRRDKGNVAGASAPAAAAQLHGAADVPIPVNLAGVYDQSFQLAGPLPASRSDISLASPFA